MTYRAVGPSQRRHRLRPVVEGGPAEGRPGPDPAKRALPDARPGNRHRGIQQPVRAPDEGPHTPAVEQCDGWDPFELLLRVPKDRVPHIYVDAKKFLKLLIDHGNEFTYSQWKGRHEDSYWAQEVKHSMAVEYAVIQRSLAKEKK